MFTLIRHLHDNGGHIVKISFTSQVRFGEESISTTCDMCDMVFNMMLEFNPHCEMIFCTNLRVISICALLSYGFFIMFRANSFCNLVRISF